MSNSVTATRKRMQSNRRGEHAVPMYGNERIGEQDNSTRHFVRKNNKHPIHEFTNRNMSQPSVFRFSFLSLFNSFALAISFRLGDGLSEVGASVTGSSLFEVEVPSRLKPGMF